MFAAPQLWSPTRKQITAAAGLTLGVSNGNHVTSGSSMTVTLPSANAGDIMIVTAFGNTQSSLQITGASGSSLGAFTQRHTTFGFSSNITTFWIAVGSAIGSTETITLNFSEATSYADAVAWTVTGSPNTGAPFDTNGSLPAMATFGGSGCAIPMTQTNDFAFYASTINSANTTVMSGFTEIYNTNFFIVGYKTGASGTETVTDPPSGGAVIYGDALRGT